MGGGLVRSVSTGGVSGTEDPNRDGKGSGGLRCREFVPGPGVPVEGPSPATRQDALTIFYLW